MWGKASHRLALLELRESGRLRRRESQAQAWEELLRLGWMGLTSRVDEAALDPSCTPRLEAALDACWSDWRAIAAELKGEELPPREQGMRELLRRRRAREVAGSTLPARMNRRTAAAMAGAHSKAALTPADEETLRRPEIVSDGLIRMRPPAGLCIVRGEVAMDCRDLSRMLGEVVLTERALRDGTHLRGRPCAVLSVENRGAYLDLAAPEGWLVLHAPGWDVAAVVMLMREELSDVPWLHFGDLDPQGVAIAHHLRSIRPDVGWLVPEWAREMLPARGLRKEWPDNLVTAEDPALVRELARRGRWLEQEALALDPRLGTEMEAWRAGG